MAEKHLDFQKRKERKKKREEKPNPVSWENNSAKRTAGQGVFQQILCTFFFLFTIFLPAYVRVCVHVCSFTFPRRYFMRKVYTAPLRRRRHLLPAIRNAPSILLSTDILKTLSTRQLGNQKKKKRRTGERMGGRNSHFLYFLRQHYIRVHMYVSL